MLTGVLFLPFAGPIAAFRFLLERLHDEAESVLHDEGRVFAELIDLSMRRNTGQLSEAEFVEQEAEVLGRLNSIRQYRNEMQRAEPDEYDDEAQLYDEPDEGEDAPPYDELDEMTEEAVPYTESDEFEEDR